MGDSQRNPDKVYGAIDLGSNNCRLLLARPNYDGFTVVDSFSKIVRLGEGVQHTGMLSDKAMARAIEVLKRFRAKLSKYDVLRFRGVATAACREAANCELFLNRAYIESGIDLKIVSDAEEAFLVFDACSSLLDNSAKNALLFDIGGCSTELIWIELVKNRRPMVVQWISIQMGVVTLAERYGGDIIEPVTYDKMVEAADLLISPFIDKLELNQQETSENIQVMGTSGTVTTLTGLHLSLTHYDRKLVDGFQMRTSDITLQKERLLAMNLREREEIACVGRGRGDLIVAGCAILEAITCKISAEVIHVADRGLREGILTSMMREDMELS